MESYEDFFKWCGKQGLERERQIAAAFGRNAQTVRNWKQIPEARPPRHLALSCIGYEETRRGKRLPDGSVAWFDEWRQERGLTTLDSTGAAFGLTRQAVHNWYKRHRLPRWLPLACLGYDAAADG